MGLEPSCLGPENRHNHFRIEDVSGIKLLIRSSLYIHQALHACHDPENHVGKQGFDEYGCHCRHGSCCSARNCFLYSCCLPVQVCLSSHHLRVSYGFNNRIRPPSDYWKITVAPQPNCINQTAHLLTAGIINTLTDFCVVIIPIPTVYRLELESRQRIIVIVIFGVGFLVCFVGAVRTVYTYIFSVSYDATWDALAVWISSTVELYVGIVSSKPLDTYCD